jgi:hypothetical protein
VIPVLVTEDKRGREALRRSWNLVRGLGWHVFGTIVVAGLLTGIVNSLLTAPFGDNWAVRSIAASIASVITMPFMALACVVLTRGLHHRLSGPSWTFTCQASREPFFRAAMTGA